MNWSKMNTILNVLLILLVAGYIGYYFYKQPKFDSGEKAKDFTATLLTGEVFHLSDLKGKYVLLDFWGSWCGPCRMENPSLVALKVYMMDKKIATASGFEIVSVGIETKRENWEKAIAKDGLTWRYQIGEFERFASPIATLYGVNEIPTKYLINPDGMIIMVNPSVAEVKDYMTQQLEQ